MTTLVIAACVLGPAYVLLTVVHPVHRCPRCRGAKVLAAGKTRRPCPRCRGAGRAYRRGAITVHRLLREHAWPWLRDRISAAVAARTGNRP